MEELNYPTLSTADLKSSDTGVQIFVSDPITKENFTKFTCYTVNGTDREGNFNSQRRFSDFVCLRKAFLKQWPGLYIPPIPPKKAIVNLN